MPVTFVKLFESVDVGDDAGTAALPQIVAAPLAKVPVNLAIGA